MNTFGRKLKITIFGESHGSSIGAVIDGLPSGVKLDLDYIKKEMERRAPGKNKISTQRKESDDFIIESGFFNGFTTGTSFCVRIKNSDTHSKDYSILKSLMRPSHGDYPGFIKYNGFNDYRGGGNFSGRLTAPIVFAGAVAKQILREKYKIDVVAHIYSIKDVEDSSFNLLGESNEVLGKILARKLPVLDEKKISLMEEEILKAKEKGNSVGGIVECIVNNLPVGLGLPFFDSVESVISHAIFSIPSVKAIEFGKGFDITKLFGNEANDEYYYENDKIKTKSNNNGGIVGGLTNGMPIIFRVGIKPTPSISLPQNTINILEKRDEILEIKGRHDPCIVPRVVPVVESMTAFAILDLILSN